VLAIWNRSLTRDPTTMGRFVADVLCDPDYRAGDDSGFFVAERSGDVVGFLRAIVRRVPNERMGLEPGEGWMPVFAVDPDHRRRGAATALLEAAFAWLRRGGVRHISISGKSGSAPGYVFAGVDKDAYAPALALLLRHGFRERNEAVSMSREIPCFPVDEYRRDAWSVGKDVVIETLTPARVDDFFRFLAVEFPGDWIGAARGRIRSGAMDHILIALLDGRVVGYCQWEGEHFGPFGVSGECRNHRIGAKLFVEAVQRIRAADGRTVWFNWADEDAARFYRRFGLSAMRRFAVLDKEL
jgi:ribosomal protein S18 acetylase RimI-like enzyme